MSKNIAKKLGIILLATIASSMFTIVQSSNFASADGACSINDFEKTTEVDSKAKTMTDDELAACVTKVNEIQYNCIDEIKDDETAEKCKKIGASMDILVGTQVARNTKTPIEDYVKTEGVEDMFEKNNLCLNGVQVNYSVVIEEVIDTNITDNENIINCMRNTLCVERSLGIDCVTTLTNSEKLGCSPQARDFAEAENNKASLYCQPVQVLKSNSGTDLLFLYVGTIYRWAASVIGILAVLVIVISGIQISAAAGEQQAITNAKNRIFQSLGGLVLLFLSGIILYSINPTFFTAG